MLVSPGDAVTFTINVFNQGTLNADVIELIDYIPTGLTFDASLNTAWVDNGNGTLSTLLSVANGALPVGGLTAGSQTNIDIIFNIAHNAPQGLTLTNWAEISSAADSNGNAVTDVDSTPNSDQTDDVFVTDNDVTSIGGCLLYTSPSPRDRTRSRMPSSA